MADRIHNHVALSDMGISVAHLPADTSLETVTWQSRGGAPECSLVVPVHNMERVIARNLDAMVRCCALKPELVVVVDSCEDRSLEIVMTTVSELDEQGLVHSAVVVVSEQPLYETACDVVGVAISTAPLIVEIQADMLIHDLGFDLRFRSALMEFDDIACLSGRGCHLWVSKVGERPHEWSARLLATLAQRVFSSLGVANTSKFVFKHANSFGRFGTAIACRVRSSDDSRIFLSETVMRGPLAFLRDRYQRVGGLDSQRYFLGNDDHDFTRRAWTEHRLRCGYLPIDFSSPLEDGATRAKKTPTQQNEYERIREVYARTTRASAQDSEHPTREIRRITRRDSGLH